MAYQPDPAEGLTMNTTSVKNYTNNASDPYPDLYCGNMDVDFTQDWMRCQYWCEGILFCVIGGIGLLGHLISIFVLATK